MSVQSEINRITAAKNDIKSAIETKGVSVPTGTSLSDMPSYINQIGTSVNWGEIGGTLSDQTDLQNALDEKSSVSGTNDGTNWSTLTINGTTKDIPQSNEVVLWTGALTGGNSVNINMSGYDAIRVFFRSYAGCSSFDISLLDTPTTSTSSYWTATHVYRGGATIFDLSSNAVETHYCNCGVNSAKTTFYDVCQGYYKGTTNTLRNNNAAYHVYRIVGYKYR